MTRMQFHNTRLLSRVSAASCSRPVCKRGCLNDCSSLTPRSKARIVTRMQFKSRRLLKYVSASCSRPVCAVKHLGSCKSAGQDYCILALAYPAHLEVQRNGTEGQTFI